MPPYAYDRLSVVDNSFLAIDFVLAVEASFEELSGAARGERIVGQGA